MHLGKIVKCFYILYILTSICSDTFWSKLRFKNVDVSWKICNHFYANIMESY